MAIASFALVVAPASADTPNGRASTSSTVVTLRAPVEGRVVIRESTFSMGADVPEIEIATLMCREEPSGELCEAQHFMDEYPPHNVTLSEYSVDRLEVTVGQYQRCVEAGPCLARPLASGGKRFEQPDLPVTMVSWYEGQTFCKWRGGHLPTEAQWERAARGLAGRRYSWGNTYDPYITNGGRFGLDPFDDRDGYVELAPAGALPYSRTPDGIVDMTGNAEEWVSDWYNIYPEQAQTNPAGPETGDEKVIRGGGYGSGRAWLRGSSRGHDLPSQRRPWRGFRCAYD